MVRHLQTVGHVACEAHVDDGSPDAVVLDDVGYLSHEGPRLPSEGTARFENHVDIGVAVAEVAHQRYQSPCVVVLTRHKVPATEVHPFHLRQPPSELSLDMLQGALKDVGTALAVAVAVQTGDVGRQLVGQLVGRDTEAGAGSAGVVECRSHLTVFRVHAQTEFQCTVHRQCPPVETLILRQRVERQMRRHPCDIVNLIVGEGRRERMDGGSELLETQPRLVEAARRRGRNILAEDGERLPQRVGLES